MRVMSTLIVAVCALVLAEPVRADVLDNDSDPPPVLEDLAGAFDGAGIDVLFSHESEAGRTGPSFGDRPRVAPLLGFRGWAGSRIDLEQHRAWLDAFESGARGAIAAARTGQADKRPPVDEFKRIWKQANKDERIVVTFDEDDLEVARRVGDVLEKAGYAVYLAVAEPQREPLDPKLLGRLFVEAGHVLMLDTASARLNRIVQFEADLLAELRRQKAWVDSGDEGLPPIKRGSMDVVESLGALPMKVLPGGIVLGMTPTLDATLADAAYAATESEYGLESGGSLFVLEQVSDETRKAIEGFVAIEDSHSVVDIAGGDVTLAGPLQSTRLGQRMVTADKRPFQRLSIDGAQKSLIVDHGIDLRYDGGRVVADVALEVRFYRRDDDGHAVRLATLLFTVEDATGQKRLRELTWTRPPGRHVSFDGAGVDRLVDELEQCALDAALIGTARVTAAESAAEQP